MSNNMKLIMENWRKLQEAEKHSAAHVVKKAAKDKISELEALKQLTTGLSDEEAKKWLKRHKDEIADAKADLKENAMSAGGVAGHAGQDELNEDNYEDSGEPWNPKSSSYPFQHPQKGLVLRTRNRANFNVWADNWRKENPDGQLTKAVRVAPKGEPGNAIKRMAALKGRRKYEEELMEGFMDTIKKGAIGGALAMGLAGAPADAQASTPTSGGEQTTQQAQAEYDSTTVTVGFLHAYAKHLKGKPGVELRDRHNITMKWLPIQKAVYDLGPEKALSSDRLDNDQQELLQLVIDKVGSLDAEMSQFYGQIGSGITMNEQLDEGIRIKLARKD